MTDDRFERLQRLAEQYAIERDAFEAKDRKINELHARIAELEIIAQYAGEDNAMAEQYAARIAELEAALKQSARVEASLASRIANLMDALEPFADVKVYPVLEDTTRVYDEPITYGDLRAARAAYLGEKG